VHQAETLELAGVAFVCVCVAQILKNCFTRTEIVVLDFFLLNSSSCVSYPDYNLMLAASSGLQQARSCFCPPASMHLASGLWMAATQTVRQELGLHMRDWLGENTQMESNITSESELNSRQDSS
jgi:hypothetical protein